MTSLFQLIRVHQWVKNGFVFLPIFFSGNLLNPDLWFPAIVVFISFSFVASAIYCINDIKDVEADRRHPHKCNRPIVSGKIKITTTWGIVIALIIAAFSVLALLPEHTFFKCFAVEGAYLILNLLYCLILKKYAIIDVFIIALGFVLRLTDGGFACDIWISPWIVCLTFLITLFMAFAKRRDDVLINMKNGGQQSIRRSSESYNLDYLNLTLGVLASVTIVCYLMYCIAPETIKRFNCQYVYITFIFVLAAILRYLMLTVVRGNSGSPTNIALHDRFIQLCVLCWIITFAIILYL